MRLLLLSPIEVRHLYIQGSHIRTDGPNSTRVHKEYFPPHLAKLDIQASVYYRIVTNRGFSEEGG